jgi:uncharacterized RDD family membrane protein YckC
MGEVYLAEEGETGRRVALKVLRRARLTYQDRKRFLREGRLAASLSHPHVVYIFGTNEVEGTPVIVMELAPGGTLKDRVQAGGPLEPPDAVDAILQLIAGLSAAAAAGVLHRDIKPSNCFVDSRGGVKIGDFGLSISTSGRTEPTLTETGTFMGTPAFAAPEQLRGEALDVRSDIYATGATLYYLLTGRAPIEESNLVRLVARIGQEAPPSPRALKSSVPAGLAQVVLRCLAKAPAKRFETYADLITALAPFSSVASTPARIGPRLMAGLLDFSLIMIVSSAVSPFLLRPFVKPWAVFPISTRPWAPSISILALLAIVLQALVVLTYFGVLEGIGNRSPGKRACGIRVAASGGGPVDARHVWARSFLFTVCGTLATLASLPLSQFLNTEFLNTRFLWVTSLGGVGLFPLVLQSAVGGSIFRLDSLGPFPVLFLLIFASARRRNGYAGLHDWCTATCVVEERADRAPAVSPLIESRVSIPPLAPRMGPFVVLTAPDAIAPRGLLPGYDVDLARPVWIDRREPESPAVLPSRRDLDRPARLRWLAGIRRGGDAWDAYEAVQGQSLMSLPKQPWSVVRDWARDIANELVAGLDDGSLPRLSLDRVWIGADGRARLLDWPAAGSHPGDRDRGGRSTDDLAAQRFLLQLAASAVEGRPADDVRDEPPRTTPPLPLSASRFFRTLAGAGFTDVRAMADAAASLVRQPPVLSRWRRTSHLAVCAVASSVAISWMMSWTTLGTLPSGPDGDQMSEYRAFEQLRQLDDWERQSPTPGVVERRQALEVYIAARFRRTLQDLPKATDRTARRNPLDVRKEEVSRMPVPSPDEVTRAEKVLQPWLEFQNRVSLMQQKVSRRSTEEGLLALLAGILGIVISPLLFRGGMLLRSLRIASVTSDGVESSRLRALCRALVAWTPAILLAAQESDLFHEASWTLALLIPVRFVLWRITTVVFIVAGLYAVLRPTRGIQDWLTGTWLVPR